MRLSKINLAMESKKTNKIKSTKSEDLNNLHFESRLNSVAQAKWLELTNELEINPDLALKEFEKITKAYGEKGRFYHRIDHVLDSLDQLEMFCADNPTKLQRHEKPILQLAIWFHDFKDERFKPQAVDQSAEIAQNFLKNSKSYAKFAPLLKELIMATKHSCALECAPENVELCNLMKDIDLSCLGRNKAVFDKNSENIRKEWIDLEVRDKEYNQARIDFFESVINSKSIFQTPWFASKYEKQARINIREDIIRLSSF